MEKRKGPFYKILEGAAFDYWTIISSGLLLVTVYIFWKDGTQFDPTSLPPSTPLNPLFFLLISIEFCQEIQVLSISYVIMLFFWKTFYKNFKKWYYFWTKKVLLQGCIQSFFGDTIIWGCCCVFSYCHNG